MGLIGLGIIHKLPLCRGKFMMLFNWSSNCFGVGQIGFRNNFQGIFSLGQENTV